MRCQCSGADMRFQLSVHEGCVRCVFLLNLPTTSTPLHNDMDRTSSSGTWTIASSLRLFPPCNSIHHPQPHRLLWPLEAVGDTHFLTTEAWPFSPHHKPEIRDPNSAGSSKLSMSGRLSRVTTLQRFSFPSNTAQATSHQLLQLYIDKGHDPQLCTKTIQAAPTERFLQLGRLPDHHLSIATSCGERSAQ